jgi:D-3-phosphoglycerate dehydrogenase / 2-oxoglutarate reductase
MFKVQTLNNISAAGLVRLPHDRFMTGADIGDPDAILLRSADLHKSTFGPSLKAIGRAGAGVNNIPVAAMTERGIPVFNAPGANANAVKELVIAGLILASRHLVPAIAFVRDLAGKSLSDAELHKAVEAGKKAFAGTELPGRTLAVIGLGAGFDPGLTLDAAWQLSSSIARARSLEEALRSADYVTLHVPLGNSTRHLINADRLQSMKQRVVVLNFSREGIVDEAAMVSSLDAGHTEAYVSDFPTALTINHPKCVTMPHLGASTAEAEDNCAVMVADQVRDFLDHGDVRNSVNFPELVVARQSPHRCLFACAASDHAVARISDTLAQAGVSVAGLATATRNALMYVVADTGAPVPSGALERLAALDGVSMVRAL